MPLRRSAFFIIVARAPLPDRRMRRVHSCSTRNNPLSASKPMPLRTKKRDKVPSSAKSSGTPTSRRPPACISHTRSANWRARSKSCVERKMVLPVCRLSPWSSCIISTLLGKSRKAVGSSSKIMGVSWANALAIITFCRSPSLRVSDMRRNRCSTPTNRADCRTMSLSALSNVPQKPVYGLRPNPIKSSTERFCTWGRSVSTTPISRANSLSVYSSTSLFLIYICPSSLGWKDERVRSKVDFPTPLAPSRQVSSPLLISAWMPAATVFAPCFVR